MNWDPICLNTSAAGTVATIACLPYLFFSVVKAALIFAGTVALFMIIYGGFKMVFSGGDAKQAGAAQQTITYAIIGLILVFSAFTILSFVSYITGVECIEFFSVMLNDPKACK